MKQATLSQSALCFSSIFAHGYSCFVLGFIGVQGFPDKPLYALSGSFSCVHYIYTHTISFLKQEVYKEFFFFCFSKKEMIYFNFWFLRISRDFSEFFLRVGTWILFFNNSRTSFYYTRSINLKKYFLSIV